MNAYPDRWLFEQPTRRRILAHLTLLPGDHFRSIVRTLNLSLGATRHHLAIMAKQGVVRSERMGGKLRYFAIGRGSTPPLNDTFKQYWRYRDLRMRVWMTVQRQPGASPSMVAATLGVSRQLASYHLSCLAELGLVSKGHGRYRAVDARGRLMERLGTARDNKMA